MQRSQPIMNYQSEHEEDTGMGCEEGVLKMISSLFINISSHSMECDSMLFVTNRIPYL